MLKLFQALMPREASYFDMFDRHAATLVEGANALRLMLDGAIPIADGCARIVEHETQADEIAREVLLAVRRTFVTPFDRSDIKDLISSLDDAIDQMQKTAKAVTLFEVEAFEPAMKDMGGVIVTSAERTKEAVALLRDMRKNGARLNAVTEEVTRLEEQADGMHDSGLKALFKAHRHDDPMAYIVGVEIYDHLEKVMDRFEDVANRINGIVIEHL